MSLKNVTKNLFVDVGTFAGAVADALEQGQYGDAMRALRLVQEGLPNNRTIGLCVNKAHHNVIGLSEFGIHGLRSEPIPTSQFEDAVNLAKVEEITDSSLLDRVYVKSNAKFKVGDILCSIWQGKPNTVILVDTIKPSRGLRRNGSTEPPTISYAGKALTLSGSFRKDCSRMSLHEQQDLQLYTGKVHEAVKAAQEKVVA